MAANQPKESIVHKCDKCRFSTGEDNALVQHKKRVNQVKQGKKCPKCPQVMANEKLFKMHIKNHQSGTEYQCDKCKNRFKSLSDARAHSRKSCGNITQKEVVIEIEDVEQDQDHRCNACSISYSSNTYLEKHMEEHHATDCTKCHAIFKSQDDVYKHANVCSKVLAPLMCEICNCELISKAGLKKHMERCKRDQQPNSSKKHPNQQSKEKCTNGPKCRFFKENRCLFFFTKNNTASIWKRSPGKKNRS